MAGSPAKWFNESNTQACLPLRAQVIKMLSPSQSPNSAEEAGLVQFRSLKEESQLLLAYCLSVNNPVIQLLTFDHDADELVALGWLKKGPIQNSLQTYVIAADKQDVLVEFEDKILDRDMQDRLERYKLRKRALYPWCW